MKASKSRPLRLAYTVAEAAESIGVSRWTMYRLIKSGRLPSSKIGGRVLVLVDGLLALLEKGRMEQINRL